MQVINFCIAEHNMTYQLPKNSDPKAAGVKPSAVKIEPIVKAVRTKTLNYSVRTRI
jgi:hypothetical protein